MDLPVAFFNGRWNVRNPAGFEAWLPVDSIDPFEPHETVKGWARQALRERHGDRVATSATLIVQRPPLAELRKRPLAGAGLFGAGLWRGPQPPRPLFNPGERVAVSDTPVVGVIQFRRYEDAAGVWKYKVRDDRGGNAHFWNESSLHRADAAGLSGAFAATASSLGGFRAKVPPLSKWKCEGRYGSTTCTTADPTRDAPAAYTLERIDPEHDLWVGIYTTSSGMRLIADPSSYRLVMYPAEWGQLGLFAVRGREAAFALLRRAAGTPTFR